MPELARYPQTIPTREARHGIVSRAPAGLGQPFQVVVPEFAEGDPTQDGELLAHEIRRWQARATTIPAVGDECLVVVDDQEEPWVAAWWPAAGDAAIEGGGKGGDKNYVHEQGVSAAEWTIVHGLEKIPAVIVFDGSGQEYQGEVTVVNVNTIKLTFNAALSGKAVLN